MKTLIYIFCFLFTCNLVFCQVGINSSSPDSSAVLDLNSNSNNQGLLVPRLSMDQIVAISNPAEGLLVYCTNLDIFCMYTGGEWTSLRPWKQDADLSTNQNIIANLPNGGNVGVGVDSPFSQLTVNGNTSVGANPNPTSESTYAPPANSLYVQNRLIVANNITDSINVANPYAIQAAGNIDARNGKIQESGYDLVPRGVIVLWHGASNAIPKGWALCDGSKGTPNLQGRFVMGAGSRQLIKDSLGVLEYLSPSSFAPGQKYGADYVQLTIDEMPSHNHPLTVQPHHHGYKDKHSVNSTNRGSNTNLARDNVDNDDSRTTGDATVDISMANIGGNDAHENRPPYYVLCYIMKL